ncbi:MAG: hypothetical protein OXG49_09010 [Chloroflexi bacterium]|nr:hypothetical protein [Chloroflexota bacterium]
MKRLILLAVLALFCAMPAFLQDERNCDTASLKATIRAQLQEIEDDPISAFNEIIQLSLGGLFGCSDDRQTFSGQAGAQPVLGPLALHEGFYIVKLTTEGSARVEAVSLESCGKDLISILFNTAAGQAINGAENLIQAEADCTVYLEVSKISASWTLEIDRVQ